MKIPAEFRQMALHMHQDIELLVKSEDELFEYLASVPEGPDLKGVTEFIDKLISSDLTDRELADIWGKSGADWILREGYARSFFERLREEIVGKDGR